LPEKKGAKKLISGAYFLHGQDLRFECKIIDPGTGKIENAITPESGPVEDPFPAMVILQDRLIGGLAVNLDPDFKAVGRGISTPSYAAWKECTEARRCESNMEFKKARGHYHKAYDLDNNFIFGRLREAFYFFALVNAAEVDLQRANAILEEVNKEREKLTPLEQAFLDWMKACLGNDLEGSLQASKKMMRYTPAAQFQYAQDCLVLNRAQEAIEILNRPDTKPSVGGQEDWLWRVKTIAYLKLDHRKKALKAAYEALRLYPDRDDNLRNGIMALAALGRMKEISQRWEEHKDEKGILGHMSLAAQMLYFYGYKKAYSEVSNLVVDWHKRRVEEEAGKPDFRHSYAFSLYTAGRWEEAKNIWKQLAQEYPDDRRFNVYLGLIAAWQGDRDEALRIENILEKMDRTFYFRGCIAALLGEKDRALTLLKESLKEGETWLYLFKAGMRMELKPLLDYPPFQEFVKPKD
jgi:tetratricopeptide (TPR) repeat protein